MDTLIKQMYCWHTVLKYKFIAVAIGWLSHTQAESQEPLLLAATRPQGPPQWEAMFYVSDTEPLNNVIS